MRIVVCLVVVCLVVFLGFQAGASAQEASPPLRLTVKPSSVERSPEEEARRRQERLEERMRRNDFLFRSICKHCAPADRFDSNAPFNPQEALRGG